jgi:hypothetical protein
MGDPHQPAHLALRTLEDMRRWGWRFFESREALDQQLDAELAARESEAAERRRHMAQRRRLPTQRDS